MWQPIETAPKDETPVLLFCPNNDSGVMVTAQWCNFNKYWSLMDCGAYAADGEVNYDPSHWQPLPASPSA